MADRSEIAWCDSTFNPWIGCTKVGPGCDNCYAEAEFDKRRHRAQWGPGQARSRTSPANWKLPLRWNAKRFMECKACGWRGECDAELIGCDACGSVHHLNDARRRVFCASLADVFDNEVPRQWRQDLFDLILATPNLDWLLLTKRIGNVRKMLNEIAMCRNALLTANDEYRPPDNVWLGATVCNQVEADRDIPKLLAVPAHIRFLSMEPLLGPVDLHNVAVPPEHDLLRRSWEYEGYKFNALQSYDDNRFHQAPATIDWVIVGGESGPKARPMHPEWVRGLRDQCAATGVPFLFKQHGEWLATELCDDDMAMIPSKRTVYVRPNGTFHDGSDGIDFFGGDQETAWVGKKKAGCLINGIEHNGYPKE